MKNELDMFFTHFGFDGSREFLMSLCTTKFMMLTIPFSFAVGFLENLFGLKALTMVAFAVLLSFELLSGLMASKYRNIPFTSRRFARFGLKLMTWMVFIFILNSMKLEYKDNHALVYDVFDWISSTIIVYVSLEYMISIDENISTIVGKKSKISTIIRDGLANFLDTYKKPKEE